MRPNEVFLVIPLNLLIVIGFLQIDIETIIVKFQVLLDLTLNIKWIGPNQEVILCRG